MFSRKTAPLRKSTSNALSSAILMFLFFGFVPPGAQATDVVVEGTVEEEAVVGESSGGECVIQISEVGTINLGTPTLVTPEGSSPYYQFLSSGGINVMWSTSSVNDCAGSLHADRGDITRTVGQTTTTVDGLLGLEATRTGAMSGVTYLNGLGSVQVDTSRGGLTGDNSSFDVGMQIEQELGAGTYRSTITFTAVVG